MSIENIYELCALEGAEFVTEVYRNLLGREPDEHGLAYYLGRLALGYGKEEVVAQIASSPECRPHDEIVGLKALISRARRLRHWFWRMFGHRDRWEKALKSGLTGLARIDGQLGSLHGAMLAQAQQIGELVKQVAQLQSVLVAQTQIADGGAHLPIETVRQCYREILGREPENETVIGEQAKLGSIEKLRNVLLNSEEFQMRVNTVPEYARTILKRHLQLLGSGIES